MKKLTLAFVLLLTLSSCEYLGGEPTSTAYGAPSKHVMENGVVCYALFDNGISCLYIPNLK